MDGWMDGRTDRFPPVFYRTPSPPVPSRAAAQKTRWLVRGSGSGGISESLPVMAAAVVRAVVAMVAVLVAQKKRLY